MMVDETCLPKPVPTKVDGNNKQVETELSSPQVEYETGLGAPALQQRVRSPQAPSGRRALHTPHTGAHFNNMPPALLPVAGAQRARPSHSRAPQQFSAQSRN